MHALNLELLYAAVALITDIKNRHPQEEFRCPHLRRLEAATDAIIKRSIEDIVERGQADGR